MTEAAQSSDGEGSQEVLDRRLGVTPADRAALREGRMPEALRKSGRSLGCLSFLVAGLGAAAGAIFGWNTGLVLAHRVGLTVGTFTAGCTAVGAVLAVVIFRRRFGPVVNAVADTLREGRVHEELLELRAEADPGGKPRLVAADGRTFQVPARFGPAPLAGSFRAFYVEVGEATTSSPASPFREPRLIVALERAG